MAKEEASKEAPKEGKPTEKKLSPEELKKRLADLNEKKEAAFRKKQTFGTQIAEKIKQISEYKRSRNALTKQVRVLKKDRDKLNSQITEKIEEIKKTRPKKEKAPTAMPKDARGRPLKPHMLKKQIQELEQKIETVPMSFEAEQKTMKTIKLLKKQLDQIGAAAGMSAEAAAKSKEIDALKKEANALHAKVTDIAKESQGYHEKMLALGKEIDDLKKEEDTVYQEFLKYKQEYVALSGDVGGSKEEEKKARVAKKKAADTARKKKEAADKKTLKQRAKEAEDKIAKGEKLTTEDLLAMQSLKD